MPTVNPMTFMGSPICPYCQRVELALRDAELPHRVQEVDFLQPAEEHRQLSAFGRFPVLRTAFGTLFESGAIVEWVNEERGGVYLPKAPEDRARVRGLCAAVDVLHGKLRAYFTAETEPLAQRAYAQCVADLRTLESLGGPWSSPRALEPGASRFPFISAFYLAPLGLLCRVLETPRRPLLGAVPGLDEALLALEAERPALRALHDRVPAVARFFLQIPSVPLREMAPRLAELGAQPVEVLGSSRAESYFRSRI